MALQRETLRRLAEGCRYLDHFKRGNLSGARRNRGDWVSQGQLPEGWYADLKTVTRHVYVVYSYQTPIAWTPCAVPDGETSRRWIVPPVTYSASTTNHQNAVRAAIVANGDFIGNDRVVVRTP